MLEYQISTDIKDYENCIKLDLNEYDFEHHPDMNKNIKEIFTSCKSITHYSNIYNKNTIELIDLISKYNNVENNEILLTAGSDDGLEYIVDRYISNNTYVIIFVPSYNYFDTIVKRKTNNIIYIPLDFNQSIDIEIYLQKIDINIINNSVVYIVNPSNPLGLLYEYNSIKNCLKEYPTTLFIIDEAYIEFIKENTCTSLIKDNINIIITRTFSKAYGLAGLRLGYILTNSNNINYIKILYNEKNTTDIAKIAGITIYKNINYYEEIINKIIDIKNDFQKFLKDNNIHFIPSSSNFISIYIGDNIELFLQTLKESNIFVRNRNNEINMKGYIRITIGTEKHMKKVKQVFLKHLEMIKLQ